MLPEDPVPDVCGREPAGGLGRGPAAAAQVGQGGVATLHPKFT